MPEELTGEENKEPSRELEITQRAFARVSMEWETTFNSVSDAIWILDDKHHIVRCNRASEILFNRSSKEMISRFCWEIVHGTDRTIPECPVARSLKSLKREMMELQIDNKWFQVTADPILDRNGEYKGAVHIVRDITENKKLEKELIESEKKYRNLFENGSDLLCVHDLKGKLLETNLSFKKEYGFQNKNINGLNIRDFFPDRYRPEFDKYLERVIQNGEDEGYMQVMSASGDDLILEYKNRLI